jgi:hypothetical protein
MCKFNQWYWYAYKEPKEKLLQFHLLVGWVGDIPAVWRVYSVVGTQDCLRAVNVSSKRSMVQAISNGNENVTVLQQTEILEGPYKKS